MTNYINAFQPILPSYYIALPLPHLVCSQLHVCVHGLAVAHSEQQLLSHDLLGAVLWQQQREEAGVGVRELLIHDLVALRNERLLRSTHTHMTVEVRR